MFTTGTATDYLDLLEKLNTYLTAKGSAFGLSYVGTGNGAFTAYGGGASSVSETFTITATSSTNFTVVGSVSGSIGPATVGTPFAHAKIEFLISAGGTAFIAGDAFQISTAPKWTKRRGKPTASSTRWRVNFSTTQFGINAEIGGIELRIARGGADQAAGSGGTATSSSSSGTHTADKAFDADNSTYLGFTGTSGWVEYAFGSAKTIVEVAIIASSSGSGANAMIRDFDIEYWDGSAWRNVGTFRNEDSWTAGVARTFPLSEYIWSAPGNDGLSDIVVGAAAFENPSTGFYNWRLNGFTAFDASADYFAQPGAISSAQPFGPMLPLANSAMAYWFVVNGRRAIVIARSSSTYGAAYLGLIQPYQSPGQWPYPLFVGGSLYFDSTEPAKSSVNYLVGTAHSTHTTFALPFQPLITGSLGRAVASSGRLRTADGTWVSPVARSDFYTISTQDGHRVWPYAFGHTGLKPNLDGSYPIFPIVFTQKNNDNLFGQMDGVHAPAGTGLTAEATITIGRTTYIAFPDVTRSGNGDFFAVKLD